MFHVQNENMVIGPKIEKFFWISDPENRKK